MEVVTPSGGRRPLGAYSLAVCAGGFVHVAGHTGWDYDAGEVVPGDFDAEARAAYANLTGTLRDAGVDTGAVVKTTVYLTDLGDAPAADRVFGAVFPDNPPARTTVGVDALPAGARIEVDAVAVDS